MKARATRYFNGIVCVFIAVSAFACADKPCRRVKRPDLADATQPAAATKPEGVAVTNPSTPEPGTKTIFIYKPDGSLQCQVKKGVSVEEMEKELVGFKVVSRQKRPDGLMHIQACGTPTGLINVYEISSERLADAEKLGFKKWER